MSHKLTREIHKGLGDKFRAGVGWKGSLDEYIELVRQDIKSHIRTSVQYIADMIEHFGHTDYINCGQRIRHYNVFDDPFVVREGVFGQDRVLMDFVSQLKMTGRGSEERIIVLRGPVATAKSTIVRLLMRGGEEYSKLPEGGVYTFNWLFPRDGGNEMGFLRNEEKQAGNYAHLKRSEADSNVPCQMNDNPLLLYPRQQRRELLEKIIAESGKKIRIPPKLIKSELCFNCQTIYNRLLEEYDGDFKKVLEHIQVERVGFSEVCQIGGSTVYSSANTEGEAPVIAMETNSYRNIVEKLKGISLHKFSGKWVDANRGLIHFSDIFKKPAHYLQYLLNAVQEHTVDFNGVLGYIDVLMMITTNLEEFAILRDPRHGSNKGLLDRIRVVDVGYILQPSEEAKIYERRFNGLGYSTAREDEEDRHMMPHVAEMLGLWCVLTRLKRPDKEFLHFMDLTKEQIEFAGSLPPLIKAKLYDGKIHSRFSFAKNRNSEAELSYILKMTDAKIQRALRNEHPDEGMFGVSPRTIQDTVAGIISAKEEEEAKKGWRCACLNFTRLKQGLEKLIDSSQLRYNDDEDDEGGSEILTEVTELLKIGKNEKVEANYGELIEHLMAIEREYNNLVVKDIVHSFIAMPEEQRRKMIDNYLEHAEAFNAGNTRDGMPDERVLSRIEELMGVDATQKESVRRSIIEQRNNIMIKIGKISGCGETDFMVGEDFIYDYLFKPLTEGLFREKVRMLDMDNDRFVEAVRSQGTQEFDSLHPDQQTIISSMIESLIKNHNYCENCVKGAIAYAFTPRGEKIGPLLRLDIIMKK
ncbi:MAG: hypothetical protein KJ955_08755 [Nanoarchaeota archaeon]|nr:hypothetical protein [Nanoarchaeota archaeon]